MRSESGTPVLWRTAAEYTKGTDTGAGRGGGAVVGLDLSKHSIRQGPVWGNPEWVAVLTPLHALPEALCPGIPPSSSARISATFCQERESPSCGLPLSPALHLIPSVPCV